MRGSKVWLEAQGLNQWGKSKQVSLSISPYQKVELARMQVPPEFAGPFAVTLGATVEEGTVGAFGLQQFRVLSAGLSFYQIVWGGRGTRQFAHVDAGRGAVVQVSGTEVQVNAFMAAGAVEIEDQVLRPSADIVPGTVAHRSPLVKTEFMGDIPVSPGSDFVWIPPFATHWSVLFYNATANPPGPQYTVESEAVGPGGTLTVNRWQFTNTTGANKPRGQEWFPIGSIANRMRLINVDGVNTLDNAAFAFQLAL